MEDPKIWQKPTIDVIGNASELILGGNNSDPKSSQQPNDFVFQGFSAGTV